MEGFRDGSGLVAVAGHPAAASIAVAALGALSHRGGSAVALAVSDGQHLRAMRARGGPGALPASQVDAFAGSLALGQVSGGLGDPDLAGLPLDGGDRLVMGAWSGQSTAVALSGRFTNGTRLRRELKARGALFQTESDAEVLLHLIAQSSQRTPVNRVVDALWKVEGAFSALLLGPDTVIAVRDPRGFRPLVFGRLDGAFIVAAEDTALREVGADVQREVEPGELLVVQRGAVRSVRPFTTAPRSACAQELIGLARQDGTVFARSPWEVRVDLGVRLGRDAPCGDAELVVALPDDEPFGVGYARATGLPYERALGLERNGDDGRLHAIPAVLRGRRVVLVGRSLLTGRDLRRAVAALRAASAVDVHVRVATPAVRRACVYGVPSPTTDELAWTHRSDPDALAAWLEATTAGFLTHDALRAGLGDEGWCTACMSGERPVVPEEPDDQLPLF